MRALVYALVILASTNAWAQDKVFEFKLTLPQVNVLAKGLGELPFKEANPLMIELLKQFNAQEKKDVMDKPVPTEPPNPSSPN